MLIRHFLISQDANIREFSNEQAALVASGSNCLPEFAGERVRYLQISVDDGNDTEVKVQTTGAALSFDAQGRMAEATPPGEQEAISRFEHDACVMWALKDFSVAPIVFH